MSYHFGRNVEYLDWCIKALGKKISDKSILDRHVLAEIAVNDAKYSLQKLQNRFLKEVHKEVDFASMMEEWHRIFDQVRKAEEML